MAGVDDGEGGLVDPSVGSFDDGRQSVSQEWFGYVVEEEGGTVGPGEAEPEHEEELELEPSLLELGRFEVVDPFGGEGERSLR